ncbi:hypothetical protein SD71_12795 [Cohnella kolymensis]|uniref:PepSY domain-containing protein n=1 Tax=Cohnella kolymensis TaxID=1590652 RepID=A0ABR5A390_9BACL|nr:hypothetical protein [Cohnella kolymensis]KIL35533.1 hypothetical protein SD71_12795 [Cohnella kolymensis]
MSRVLLFSLFMIISLFTSTNPFVTASELDNNSAALQRLAKNSGGTLKVIWNEQTNTPSILTGTLSVPSMHSPQWIAYEFLKQAKSIYGLHNPERDMKIIDIERSQDKINVRLQHLLFETPVWGNCLVIDMDIDGVIRRVEGTVHPNLEKQLFNRPMHAAITKNEAIATAKATTQGQLANEPTVYSYYLPSRTGTPLIYVVQLQYSNPEIATTTLIHSLTGRVLEQYKK